MARGGQRRILVGILCLFVLSLCPFSIRAQDGQEYERSRPFQGMVRSDMAHAAARTAAELAALESAMRFLARQPALRFVNEENKDTGKTPPDLPGLTRFLYATHVLARGIRGFPPAMEAWVTVALVPSEEPIVQSISAALRRPDLVQLCSLTFKRQKALLAEYDARSRPLLVLAPNTGGKKMDVQELQRPLDGLRALDAYLSLLPLRQQTWSEPQKTREAMLRAHALDPESPCILVALAELDLQLNRPAEALEYATAAIRLAPNLYPAHNVKGVALLRQSLPALAAQAFGEAIALAPGDPEPYAHRAAALLVQEELPAMCADFRSACARGDCSGYRWAVGAGKCQEGKGVADHSP